MNIRIIFSEIIVCKTYALKLFCILVVILFLFNANIFSQNLSKKPKEHDVISYNKKRMLNVGIGMTKANVIEVMGGVQEIKIKEFGSIDLINNPDSRDLKTDPTGKLIEVIWYYTGYNENGPLTPIIFENNVTVGLGWGFYKDYAKKNDITIKIR